jgi:replicative DNA helicase
MEDEVINGLLTSDAFFSKAYSHLKPELFENPLNLNLYNNIDEFVSNYQDRPSIKDIVLKVKQTSKLNEPQKIETLTHFKELLKTKTVDNKDFLLNETQKWIKTNQVKNSVLKTMDLMQRGEPLEPVIGMMEDSLNVVFDDSLGLDYKEDIQTMIDFYNREEAFTPIGLKPVDDIIGGIDDSTLTVIGGFSSSGKSFAKVFISCNWLLEGLNVLFITLEMPEEKIVERFDSNLMNMSSRDFRGISKETYLTKRTEVDSHISRLRVKEFPVGFTGTELKHYLDELKTKSDFVPDAIFVDYINKMGSTRASKNIREDQVLSKAAQDLYDIAKHTYNSKGKKGVKMVTSTQLNRTADGNVEVGMSSVADAIGIMQNADTAILILYNDQMDAMNQRVLKIVKSRSSEKGQSILVGIDFSKSQFIDLGSSGDISNYKDIINDENIQEKTDEFDLGSFNF